MNCNINTQSGNRCKNNVKAGATIEINGRIVYCCGPHFDEFNLKGFGMERVAVSTPKLIEDMQERMILTTDNNLITGDKESITMDEITEAEDMAQYRGIENVEVPFNETITITGVMEAIAYAKRINWTGKLPKIEGTNTYQFPADPNAVVTQLNITEEETKPMNGGKIKCGNCLKNKVDNPYNHTVDDVKKCYGVVYQPNEKKGAQLDKNMPMLNNEGEVKWVRTYAEAVDYCADGKHIFREADNGHGWSISSSNNPRITLSIRADGAHVCGDGKLRMFGTKGQIFNQYALLKEMGYSVEVWPIRNRRHGSMDSHVIVWTEK